MGPPERKVHAPGRWSLQQLLTASHTPRRGIAFTAWLAVSLILPAQTSLLYCPPPCSALPPFYQPSSPMFLVRPRVLREGHRTCPQAVLGLYPTGLHWHGLQASWSHHGFPSAEGAWGLPSSHASWAHQPEPPCFPLIGNHCTPGQAGPGALRQGHREIPLARPASSGTPAPSWVPNSLGLGEQKPIAFAVLHF